MRESLDIIEAIASRRTTSSSPARAARFLSIWYHCCHAYGRLHRDDAGTAYTGRCPRCGRSVRVPIGPDGTTRRVFGAG